MTDDERATLASVKALAAAGRFFLSTHARERAEERGVRVADVRVALVNASHCADQRADVGRRGDWLVTGPDRVGEELRCAVVLRGSVLVVTVY